MGPGFIIIFQVDFLTVGNICTKLAPFELRIVLETEKTKKN